MTDNYLQGGPCVTGYELLLLQIHEPVLGDSILVGQLPVHISV